MNNLHIPEIEYNDHICLLYDDIMEYRQIATKFILDGIYHNDLVVCVLDVYREEMLIDDFKKLGIDANQLINENKLIFSSIRNTYRGASKFNPDNTLKHWTQLAIEQKKQCRGIRVMGEATFALDGNYETLERLVEYEIRLNIDVHPIYHQFISLCVYDKRLYPKCILEKIIKAHPIILNTNEIIRRNPIFENPHHQLEMFYASIKLQARLGIPLNHQVTNFEEYIRTDDERFRYVLEGIGDGVWDFDLEQKSIYVSKSLYKLMGYDENSINETFKDLNNLINAVHPEDSTEVLLAVNRVLEGKDDVFRVEHRIMTHSGEWRWVSNFGRGSSKTENGVVTRLIGVVKDIQQRKNVEIQSKLNEERFLELANNIDSIFWIREKDRFLYISPAYEKIWGRSCTELYDDPYCFIENIHAEDKQMVTQKHSQENYAQKGIEHYEYRIVHPENQLKWIKTKSFPICNDQGQVTKIIGISEDITSIKEREEEIKEAKKLAEQANIAKSNFLANMSHEIRTPMNGIMGMTDLTLMTDLTDEQKENLTIIKSSSDALLKIVNDILQYAKIEAGRIDVSNEPFKLSEIVAETIHFFYVSAKNKRIALNYSIDKKVPDMFIGDHGKIRQVLSNLIGNAIKFTNEGSVDLKVSLIKKEQKKATLEFCVVDTGIGIPEDQINKLFTSFYQVNTSYSKKYPGTGLGLAITKELLSLLNGKIWVKSQVGVGSSFCFTVDFEMVREEVAHQEDTAMNISSAEKRYSVLLVEDDKSNRIVCERMLERAGYKTVTAENGLTAVEEYKKNHYDLVLMDIQMPVLDGISATKLIREHEQFTGQYTPIIALTAYALQGDRERFLNEGMDDYISKPINMNLLIDTLIKWLHDKMGDNGQ